MFLPIQRQRFALKLVTIDPPQSITIQYAVATIRLVAIAIICLIVYSLTRFLASLSIYVILKHVIYSSLPLGRIIKIRFLWSKLLLAILYTSANTMCLAFKTHLAPKQSTQAALLLATNLVFLLPRANIAADTLHISLQNYQKIHQIISRVALVEAVIYTII